MGRALRAVIQLICLHIILQDVDADSGECGVWDVPACCVWCHPGLSATRGSAAAGPCSMGQVLCQVCVFLCCVLYVSQVIFLLCVLYVSQVTLPLCILYVSQVIFLVCVLYVSQVIFLVCILYVSQVIFLLCVLYVSQVIFLVCVLYVSQVIFPVCVYM